MSPGSLPTYGADENPHSTSPTTTIAIPAKTRLFPIGPIAVLTQARLYKTDAPCNTRAPRLHPRFRVRVGVRFDAGGLARRERLLDDLFSDRSRSLLVMREVLLEGAAARRDRAQVRRVLQDFRHRHLRLDHLAVAFAVHAENLAAARVQIADHVAHAFVGTRNFDRDDRLKDDWPGLFEACLEAHRGRDLKRHVRRIDVMIAAVEDGDPHVDHRIAGQESVGQSVAHAFFDRRNEVARDDAADDVVDELEALAARHRLDLQPAIAVLPAAAGLALVLALRLGAALDGFLVRNLGRLQLDVDVEFPPQFLHRDFDVHLTGARQNDVVRLRVAMHLEREIFFDQLLQRRRRLLLVTLGLWANGERDNAVGTRQRRHHEHGRLLVAQSVAGGGVFQLGDGDDFAGDRARDRRLLLALEAQQLAEALLRFARRVEDAGIGRSAARNDAEDGELAGERIDNRLEHERGEPRRRIGRTANRLARAGILAFDRRALVG